MMVARLMECIKGQAIDCGKPILQASHMKPGIFDYECGGSHVTKYLKADPNIGEWAELNGGDQRDECFESVAW